MPLDVIVRRDPCGPYKYEDITEPLLGSSMEAAATRGAAVLDENGTGLQAVEYVIIYQPGLRCGLLVRLFDTLAAQMVYGKIVSVEHTCSRQEDTESVTLLTKLKLMMPTQFFSISI